MNVPAPDESALTVWLRKVQWVIIAILAPEYVAYVALQQWARAMAFRKELNKLRTKHYKTEKVGRSPYKSVSRCLYCLQERSPETKEPEQFGKTYAFYAVMGGFCADVSFMHNTWTRVTITTEGLLFLAENGYFMEIKGDYIRDKSKADLLAKGLVGFQILWLAGQAIERKIAGYPVTLLEIHTLVHVLCAVCMFSLWLFKPFDVRDATVVNPGEGGKVQEYIAWLLLFLMSREMNGPGEWIMNADGMMFPTVSDRDHLAWHGHLTRPAKDESIPDITDLVSTYAHRGRPIELDTSEEQTANVITYFQSVHPTNGRAYSSFGIDETIGPASLRPVCSLVFGQALKCGFGIHGDYPWPIYTADSTLRRLVHPAAWFPRRRVCLKPSEKDVKRSNLAAEFVKGLEIRDPTKFRNYLASIKRDYDVQGLSDEELHNLDLPVSLSTIVQEYLNGTTMSNRNFLYREPNVRDVFSITLTNRKVLGGLLAPLMILVTAAYGAIHLSALSVPFPTNLERLLWEIACYVLIGVAGGMAVVLVVWQVWKNIYSDRRRSRWFSLFFVTFLYTAGLPSLLARTYIVIEAFLSLRHVPIGVYESPPLNFMNYVPHL